MITIVDASCKVADCPSARCDVWPCRSPKMMSILRVLAATEGVVGPCPRKTSRRKLEFAT